MRRLHPYSGAIRAIGTAVSMGSLGFFLGVSLGVAGGGSGMDFLTSAGLALLGGLVGIGYGVARYLRFEYETADGTFSMATGVFSRQERDIPYGRIQNVDIRRGVLYRILGLATVKLETAGGGSTEAVLDAVAVAEADRIQNAVAGYERDGQTDTEAAETTAAAGARREDIEDAEAEDVGAAETEDVGAAETEGVGAAETRDLGAADTDPTETSASSTTSGSAAPSEAATQPEAAARSKPRTETLFTLSTSDLALLSIVSFNPSGLALLIFSLPFGQDLALEVLARTVAAAGGPSLPSLEAITGLPALQLGFVVAVGVVEFVLAAWTASAILTAVKFYDFELARVGEDLRYERGLLQRYTGTIPLEKVQTITVRENVPMRRFGLAALDLETAGYGPGQGGSASNTAIPLDDREVVTALAERLGGIDYPDVDRPPKRARQRYAVRLSLVPLALAAVLFAAHRLMTPLPRWWLPLLVLPLAPIAGHLMWKHRGHALTERAFLARSSFWRRHTRIVPYYRIQTVIDSRSVFQRRRDLASVTADTASTASVVGGDATAHDVDEGTAVDLHRTLRERLDRDLERRRQRDSAMLGDDLDALDGRSDDADVNESAGS